MFNSATTYDYLLAGHTSNINLEELSNSLNHAVRARVAENPSTPLRVLVRLLRDANREVRISLSQNHAIPITLLKHLAQDHDPDVRYNMAADPTLPKTILQILITDENPYVAHRAAQSLLRSRTSESQKVVKESVEAIDGSLRAIA
jgi:hypothetical protein